MNQQILEQRLITFAANTVLFTRSLPPTYLSSHLGKQLTRSCTSAALNYGESRSAESTAGFIHKLSLVLKELRESHVCLRILIQSENLSSEDYTTVLGEANELISIFVKTIRKLKTRE